MATNYQLGAKFCDIVKQIHPLHHATQQYRFPVLDPQSDPVVAITYSTGGAIPDLTPYYGQMIEFRINNKYLSIRNKEVHNNRVWGGNFHLFPEIEKTLPLVQQSLVTLTNNHYPQYTAVEKSHPNPSKTCFCCLKQPEPLINSLTELQSELTPYPTVEVDTSTTQFLLDNQSRRYIRYQRGDHFYTDDSDVVAMLQHSGAAMLLLAPPQHQQGFSVICRVLPPLPFYPSTELHHTKYRSRTLNGPYNGYTLQIIRTEHYFNPAAPYPTRSLLFPTVQATLELIPYHTESKSEIDSTTNDFNTILTQQDATKYYYSHPILSTATQSANFSAISAIYQDDTRTNLQTLLKMIGGDKVQPKIYLKRQLTDDIMGFSSLQSDCLYLSYQQGLAILNRWFYPPPIAFSSKSQLNPLLNGAFNPNLLISTSSSTPLGLPKAQLTISNPFSPLFSLPTATPLSPYDLPTSFQLLQYNLEIVTRCCLYVIQVTGTTPLRSRLSNLSSTLTDNTNNQSTPSNNDDTKDKKRTKRSRNTQTDALSDQELVSLLDPSIQTSSSQSLSTTDNNNQFELTFSISSITPKPQVPYIFTALRLFHLRHLHTLFQFLPNPPEFDTDLSQKESIPSSMSSLAQSVSVLLSALPNDLTPSTTNDILLTTIPSASSTLLVESNNDVLFPDMNHLHRIQQNPLTLPFSDPDIAISINIRYKQYALLKLPGLSASQSKILAAFACLHMKQNQPLKYLHLEESQTHVATVGLTRDVLGAIVDYFTHNHDSHVLAANLSWDDFIWTEDNLIIRQQSQDYKETSRILGIRFLLK